MAPSGTKRNATAGCFGCLLLVAITIGVIVVLFQLWGFFISRVREAQAENDVANLQSALQAYISEYDETPSRTNSEILAALRGGNPRKIIFFEVPPNRFNPKGEFLDPWKTPYHIDLTDRANPRIHSSGPDKQDNHGAPGSDDITSWR